MNSLKEFFTYITNQLKFWFIIKEWEYGIQLRKGKILRTLNKGLYLKIPFLDFVYSKPKRTQDITLSQVNFTTKCDKNITLSGCIFYKISNIRQFYTGYAEPNTIIANTCMSEINKYLLKMRYEDLCIESMEIHILKVLKQITDKGFTFVDFNVTTFTTARTYRIIKDNLYSFRKNVLDEQIF